MPTSVKIKIVDNSHLRNEIDELYDQMNHVEVAKWSLLVAKHILERVGLDYLTIAEIDEGFKVNEQWQIGKARMHDVRQAGFKIHKLARACDNSVEKTALRVTGQAIASGHMKEHAMVASDYAIKTINLLSDNDNEAIIEERKWQLKTLRNIKDKIESL